MNNSKIKAAARQALIAADKSYYSWPPEQQEKFRATMNETAQNKVESILLNSGGSLGSVIGVGPTQHLVYIAI